MDGRRTQATILGNDQNAVLDFCTQRVGFDRRTDYSPPGGSRCVTVGPQGEGLELALFEAGGPTGGAGGCAPSGPRKHHVRAAGAGDAPVGHLHDVLGPGREPLYGARTGAVDASSVITTAAESRPGSRAGSPLGAR